jgi:K+-sensing histidine kinase KdpD
MLFIPFLELKVKQNLKQVKDNNIGMGLACSEAISSALGGDIIIQQSKRGLTVFAFKFPVQVKNIDKLSLGYLNEPKILENKGFSVDV